MIKIKFFKGNGNKFKYAKFHEPLGVVFEYMKEEIKKKRIYKTCRVIELPWFSIRLEDIPKMI